ncbi:MAG: CpsD/CapB family tyrosine-protein kinase [Oscillospiraceae bacterium]
MTLLKKDVPFQFVEAFKILRTNLIFALSQKKSNIFAVSSALPGEGKSTTAANIAISMAQTGSKILIIDADMRKPVQHKVFKLSNQKGLSTLIGGMHSFKEVLNADIIPNLDVITSGPIPPNPSEILASDNMKTLLGELSKQYNYIIIDTPPINIVTDAITIIPDIAGVILVSMQASTPLTAFQQAIDSVKFAEGAILGAVVTNVNVVSGKYNYKYKYKYSYKYRNYHYGEEGSTKKLNDEEYVETAE